MTRAEELAEKVRSRFAPIDGTATREIERLDRLDCDEAEAALSELVADADEAHQRSAQHKANWKEAEADAEALAEALELEHKWVHPTLRADCSTCMIVARYRGEKPTRKELLKEITRLSEEAPGGYK